MKIMAGKKKEVETISLYGLVWECDPLRVVEKRELHEALRDTLSLLRDYEKKIICMRYGLYGRERMTLLEIGKEFGISKERTRQILLRTLSRLRGQSRYEDKELNKAGKNLKKLYEMS